MPHYVVLLRGVNVGPNLRVPMAALRAGLEGVGARDVRTVLNSGNAVCASATRSAERFSEQVAELLQSQFGVTTPVIVKAAAEFSAIVAERPFPIAEADQSRVLVAFTRDQESLQALRAIESLVGPGEQFALTERAAYLHCAGGLLESAAGEALLGRRAKPVTTRNWGTVCKIAALLPAHP